MPLHLRYDALLAAGTLSVIAALVAVLVIGPSNRHTYDEDDCWTAYTAARTRIDTLKADRLILYRDRGHFKGFCGSLRINEKGAPREHTLRDLLHR